MAQIPLYSLLSDRPDTYSPTNNPLPQLLQTPSGLALLELQGTINLPAIPEADLLRSSSRLHTTGNSFDDAAQTPIGRLIFPDFDSALHGPDSTAWMKRVYLYVGQHQRLTGEVKKLPKAIAVIRRRAVQSGTGEREDGAMDVEGRDKDMDAETRDELEVVEIIKWKILFSQRPEPVGTSAVGT